MNKFAKHHAFCALVMISAIILAPGVAFASEADLKLPDLGVIFSLLGGDISGITILQIGMVVSVIGMMFGLVEFFKVKKLPAHQSMLANKKAQSGWTGLGCQMTRRFTCLASVRAVRSAHRQPAPAGF